MAGVFDTSASEMVNSPGNAANALGGDAGASNLLGLTDASGISDALKVVAAANLAKNKDIYDRQIKAQEDLFKQLSSDDVQLKQTLPTDRDFLWDNFRDPIRKMVMDPTVTTDYKKAAALQQKMNDFKEAKAYAAVRLTAINDMDKNIGAEKDPIRRQRMIDHRNEMYNQDIYSQVKPFQEAIDFTKETLVKPKALVTTLGSDIVGDKEVTRTKTVTPLKDFTEGVYYNYLSNPDHKIKSEMDAMANSIHEMPADQKKWLVDSWNEKITKADNDHELKEGDKDYVPPVRYDIVKDDAGNEQVVIHATTPEIVRAQSILDNYQNEVGTSEKLSDLGAKIRTQNAAAQKSIADAYLAKQRGNILVPAQAANQYSQMKEHNAKTSKTFEEIKKLKLETSPEDWNINHTQELFNPKNYKDVSDVTGIELAGLGKLPITGKLIANSELFGKPGGKLSDDQLTYLSEKFDVNGKVSYVKPDAVVYNNQNTQDPYFTTVFAIPHLSSTDKTTGKKTYTTTYETRIIKPNTFMEKLARTTSPGSSIKELNKTLTKYKQKYGTLNINGSLYSTFDDADLKPKNDNLDDFMK